VTLLADVVAASQEVAETNARSRKVAILAELLERLDPDEVADAYPDVPLLGFTNHTDTEGLRRAHEAGFDQVVAKSALNERAKDLVEDLTG